MTHTPTPWHTADNMDIDIYASGFRIAIMKGGEIRRDKANAAFIVAACNAHEKMLETLKLCRDEWPERITPCYKEICDAIALAEANP